MRCKYCHAYTEGDFCNDACKSEYDGFFASDKKRKICYWTGIITCILIETFGLMLKDHFITSIGLFIGGFSCLASPYAPEYKRYKMGLKYTLNFIRIEGVIIIIIGVIWITII